MTHVSVVIPLLNEESLINELINKVKENIEKISDEYEIILVDDGSSDNTWKEIVDNSKNNKKIKALKFSRNFGHHYAITAGLFESRGNWVVVMDGDLQDKPEVIPDLYNKAIEGYDIVFVSRQNRPEGLFYLLLQKLFYVILNLLSGIKFDSSTANFSIINRNVVEAFKQFSENSRFYATTITWLGYNKTTIPANHGKRYSGKSSYNFKRRLKLATEIIISFSERPLKFSIFGGILISILSIFTAIYYLVGKIIWDYSVTGWASLIISIFLLSGIILTILGIHGIYIGKIFNQVKSRPLYIISEKLN